MSCPDDSQNFQDSWKIQKSVEINVRKYDGCPITSKLSFKSNKQSAEVLFSCKGDNQNVLWGPCILNLTCY